MQVNVLGFLVIGILFHPSNGHQILSPKVEYNSSVVQCGRFSRSTRQHRCVMTPLSTEGPYFISDELERSDIREDREGVPLHLEIYVVYASTCLPVRNAVVHLWSCDALGDYSGFEGDGPPTRRTRNPPINGHRFLRGKQMTNKDGKVAFTTIFPGWYHGRTIHIHMEVNQGDNIVHIAQLYFSDELSESVGKQKPYSLNKQKRANNAEDFLFPTTGGKDTILQVNGDFESGLHAEMVLGLDNKASKPVRQIVFGRLSRQGTGRG